MSLVPRLSHDEILQLEGVDIVCRQSDGYINATAICKAGRTNLDNWFDCDRTMAFLAELSKVADIRKAGLIKFDSVEPIWVHPRIALNIAHWISVKFDVKISGWVQEMLITSLID